MILNQQQIEELIDGRTKFSSLCKDIDSLRETIKHLQAKEQKSRGLLKKAHKWIGHDESCESIAHGNCDCGYSKINLDKQIEEHLK